MRRLTLSSLSRAGAPALAVLATLTVGCSQDPGSLTIPFSMGATTVTCDTVGVVKVKMTLTEITEEGSDSPTVYTSEAECEAGQVEFTGIAVGTYELDALGVAADDVTIFDNHAKESLKKVEALEGQTVTTDTVALTPTPAQILVRWELKQGGFSAQCSNVMTKSFQAAIYADNGVNALLIAEPIDCDAAADISPGYHLVPDPERKIDGKRLDTVEVHALDASDNEVGMTLSFPSLTPPGYGRSVKITLACDDDVCTGTLDP